MTHLEVVRKTQNGIELLSLKGFLDAHNAPLFRNVMAELDPLTGPRVILDISQLEYTGSSGLEVILAHLAPFRRNGGDIRLAASNDRVFRVFELLGLTQHLHFYPTVEEALASYAG